MRPEDEILDDFDDGDLADADDLDDVDVDGFDDESLPDDEPQDVFPEVRSSVGFEDEVVRIGGREFAIDEPDIGITLRILKVIGRLFVRGEKVAARVIQNPGNRAVIMGMLAALDITDLHALGSAVLQFEDDKTGRKWMKDLGTKDLRLAPLVKAFFLNYAKSEDLRESLANFFVGQEMLEVTLAELIV